MPGPFPSYVQPGIYTETQDATEAGAPPSGVLLPFFIGVGQENLTNLDYEIVRGSSSVVDQQITQEDVTERFIVDASNPQNLQLGELDGTTTRFQVRHFPIVDGEGRGEVTNAPSDISVTVDGTAVEPAAVDGERGIVTLQIAPSENSEVRVTYFFNRTDTQITDDVSEQVSSDNAALYATQPGPYTIVDGTADTLELTVDGADYTLDLSAATNRTVQDVVSEINGASISGLTASVDTDNRGRDRLLLEAPREIIVGNGNANSVFGFSGGRSTDRQSTFYVYQPPIVDGTNGGIVTTDPNDVTVTVDGTDVSSVQTNSVQDVDGQNGAVTLDVPPASGATVEIQYYFNNWQETFDHLPDSNVQEVLRVGDAPDSSDYTEGDDFIFDEDDRVHWGSAVTVQSGQHTDGAEFFDDTQVSTTLIDNRIYFEPIEARVDRSQSPPEPSQTEFLLGNVPTLGNGLGDTLTTEIYDKVSNGRVDIATHRTDLVQLYHGPTFEAARARGPVEPVRVQGGDRIVETPYPIPADHNVYATYYYNRLADDELTLEAQPNGTYTIDSDTSGRLLQDVTFGTVSASDTITWPSGVEDEPDAFIVGGGDPVNETVTVTFQSSDAEPFRFTNASEDPYDIYAANSDTFHLSVNGNSLSVDLDTSAFGVLLNAGASAGTMYSVTSGENDTFEYRLDEGPVQSVTLPSGSHSIQTVAEHIWRSAPNQTELKGTVDVSSSVSTTASTTYDVTINGTNITEADASFSASTYTDASNLASAIQSTFETASGSLTAGDVTQPGNDFEVVGNSDGTVSILASEELEVADTSNSGDELEVLVGWDGGAVPNDDSVSSYTPGNTLTNVKVARTWEGADAEYLLLRSRTTPQLRSDVSRIEVLGGNANDLLGFSDYTAATGTTTATNKPASLLGSSFDSADVSDLDNDDVAFLVSIDGTEYEVPASDFDGDTSVSDVQASIDNVIGSGGAGVAAVAVEDSALRITSNSDGPNSSVEIADGAANQYIGFSEGDSAFQQKVEASEVVAVLNNATAAWSDQSSSALNLATVTTTSEYLNFAYAEASSGDFVTFASFDYGTDQTLAFESGSTNALNDTDVGVEVGDSAAGTGADDIFNVTSSKSNGSSGTGRVGQTYTDETTGLRFTVLEPQDSDYQDGDSFTLVVRTQIAPTSGDTIKAIPGVEMTVDNLTNIPSGDTAVVTTYDKSGNEPAIGDFYYISYTHQKEDFSPQTFFQFRNVTSEFGRLAPQNTLTLASYLAFLNGAALVGCKQLLKQPDTNEASSTDYLQALEELEKPLDNNVTPDLIVALTPDTTVQQQVVKHCKIQSSPRRQQERRTVIGMASGSEPSDARQLAQALSSERAVLLYPDSAVMTLENEVGESEQVIVNGTFLAAALAGHRANPAFDVATPITRKRLTGFDRLNRNLSRIEQNRLAQAGVTVLEDVEGAIRVRDGLTTDPSTVLTQNPTVTAIKDFVNQRTRATLDSFIGGKFLEGKVQDIEFSVKQLLNSLQEQEIIASSTGVTAEPNPNDPTQVDVTAFYQPIFPLKYIKVTYTVQGQSA